MTLEHVWQAALATAFLNVACLIRYNAEAFSNYLLLISLYVCNKTVSASIIQYYSLIRVPSRPFDRESFGEEYDNIAVKDAQAFLPTHLVALCKEATIRAIRQQRTSHELRRQKDPLSGDADTEDIKLQDVVVHPHHLLEALHDLKPTALANQNIVCISPQQRHYFLTSIFYYHKTLDQVGDITFEDLGGLDEAIKVLKVSVVMALEESSKFTR